MTTYQIILFVALLIDVLVLLTVIRRKASLLFLYLLLFFAILWYVSKRDQFEWVKNLLQ